jgi:hypothetical protein
MPPASLDPLCELTWGCKPKPQKIPSGQIKSSHDRIQVNDLARTSKGVVPIQQDMAPRCWRDLLDQGERLGISVRLVPGEQPRQDS